MPKTKSSPIYRDRFNGDKQVTAEEQISRLIFDRLRCSEEKAGKLGRDILLQVLQEFRPDLVAQDPPSDEEACALRSYHFSCGNSSDGQIGFCARVRGTTRAAATSALIRALPEEMKVAAVVDDEGGADSIEYIEVYINTQAIDPEDIDEEEPTQ